MSSCAEQCRTMRQQLEGAGFKMENRVTTLMEKEPLPPYHWAKLLPPRSHLKRRGQARNKQPGVQTLPVGFLLSLSSSASRAQSWFHGGVSWALQHDARMMPCLAGMNTRVP